MKFPYLRSLGKAEGWYRVGPLARLNTCDFIPRRRAQKEFEIYKAYTGGNPTTMTLTRTGLASSNFSTRRKSSRIFSRTRTSGNRSRPHGKEDGGRRRPGRSAERDAFSIITRSTATTRSPWANLIVSTTNNNEPMNRAVNWVAENMISGKPASTEGLLNRVEVAHPSLRSVPELRHARPWATCLSISRSRTLPASCSTEEDLRTIPKV